MSDCDVNDVKKVSTGDPRDAIELVEGENISISKESTPTKDIYTISYQDYIRPTITLESSIGITKVGVIVPSVTFNGNITAGTKDILTRTMTPDKSLDLTVPFSWQETNVLGTEPGLWPQFSGAATKVETSDEDNTVEKSIGIDYRHLFYSGYSIKTVLTEADIKALSSQDLLTNILSKYSTFTYNYSVVPVYIYWVFPADTPGFTLAEEGPLPVPLKLDLPNVNITDEGITKSYRVIRTAAPTKLTNAIIKLS